MAQDDELKRLRRDLDSLLEQADVLKRRLEGLERETRLDNLAQSQQPELQDIPLKVAEPPPLPPMQSFVKQETVAPRPPVPPIPKPEPKPDTLKRVAAKIPSAERTQSAIQRRIAEEGWEAFLISYIFPRIGIVLLTVAIVFTLVLAARYSTPITRVGAGYLVCAGLLGLGRWLESRYRAYARVLYSGGFALSYFVTFAAHYIEPARVITSTPVALTLLAVVVGIWAFIAQMRRSRLMATLVTLLGHLTIALAIWASGDIARYSVVGVLFLSAGSAFFLLQNRWYYVAVLGLAGSYLNHAFWALTVQGGNTLQDFCLTMAVLSGYFLIFALAELFAPEDLRRTKIPLWFRNAYVTANSACFLILGTLTVDHFDASQGHQDWFRLIFAVVLFAIGIGYLRLRARDPLFNVYMTKAVAMATLGIATIYEGNTLTAFLAVEMVALLYSARRSGLVVSRLLAFAVAALTFIQGTMAIVDAGAMSYADEGYLRHLIPAALAAIGFFAASQLYQRTDWSSRSPEWPSLNPDTHLLLWQLDLLRSAPATRKHAQKPVDGLLFPYTYALAGVAMALLVSLFLAENGHRFATMGVIALLLTILAAVLRAKPFGLTAIVGVAAALAMGSAEITMSKPEHELALALGVLALGVAAVRADRRLVAEQAGLEFHQLVPSPYFLYGATAWTLGLLLSYAVDDYLPSAAALTGAAIVAAGLVLLLHPRALAAVAVGLQLWAMLSWGVASHETDPALWHGLAWGLTAVAIVGDRYFVWLRNQIRTAAFGNVLAVAAWALMARYVWIYSADEWRPFFECLVSFAFLGYALGVRSVAAAASAIAGAAFASMTIIMLAYDSRLALEPLIAGFLASAAFWVACERLAQLAKEPRIQDAAQVVTGLCSAAAALLLVLMLHRIPQLATYYLTISWTVLAFTLFGLSLLLKQKHYRHAGLAIFFLAIGRAAIYDTQNLGGFQRVAAFAVLGVVLLIVGFGYWKVIAMTQPKRVSPDKAAADGGHDEQPVQRD
ncbi:MAG: hypothetical protein AMXMBFR82_11090 [Candidatus Hydrogenedentota bacterium]